MNKNTTDITLSAYFNDIVIGYYEDEALVKQLGRQLGFDVDMDTFMAVSFRYECKTGGPGKAYGCRPGGDRAFGDQ